MSVWTEERVLRLRTEHTNGLSARQIAKLLGDCTRSAVIGKLHRLGLNRPPQIDKPARVSIPRSPRGVLHSKKFAKVKPMEKLAPVAPLNVPFLDREPGQCRTITDDTRYEQKCCGLPVEHDGDVYCAAHKALHYTGTGRAR